MPFSVSQKTATFQKSCKAWDMQRPLTGSRNLFLGADWRCRVSKCCEVQALGLANEADRLDG